jgi:hypothetical protein
MLAQPEERILTEEDDSLVGGKDFTSPVRDELHGGLHEGMKAVRDGAVLFHASHDVAASGAGTPSLRGGQPKLRHVRAVASQRLATV